LSLVIGGCGRLRERFDRTNSNPSDISNTKPENAATAPTALLPFGNPSNAGSEDKDNYLIVHDGHLLSYNNSRGTLNWIAWKTTRADLGDHLPRHLFEPDPLLPGGFRRIAYYDYSGSGYDRGHMVPSADRFGNVKLNEDTFLMTNIVPQTAALNQFPWEKLESYARSLVYRGSEVYTIAGVYGENGRLRGRVTIPTNCWKVIVVFPRGQHADRIDPNTRIIAVDMPNIDGIEAATWETYKTTVRAIEQKTGFDLFSSLPRDFQERIETRVDGK
jgi:endonuclease G